MLAPFKGKVEINIVRRLLRGFFKVDSARIRFEGFNGQMIKPPFDILCLERGDAVAAVVHDVINGQVLLVEQFRYPTLKTGGWIFELPAGMVAVQEDPALAMLRELLEETGYKARKTEHIGTFYLSPGGSSERIWLYYMPITPQDEVNEGGGLACEGENIRRHMVPVRDALEMVANGVIMDAKTIIGLQWLANLDRMK